MRYDYQQQQQEEEERMLMEALDRFHQGQETENDLHLICYRTGLTNYRPQDETLHTER